LDSKKKKKKRAENANQKTTITTEKKKLPRDLFVTNTKRLYKTTVALSGRDRVRRKGAPAELRFF
jgi:hypothetical protein